MLVLHIQLPDNLSSFLTVGLLSYSCQTGGMFNSYIGQQEYIPEWILMHAPQHLDTTSSIEVAAKELRPGMRGGHQMCLDPSSETIYLFGGWDGNQDLCDMWAYHIPSQQWKLVSPNTSVEVRLIKQYYSLQ